MNSRRDFGLFCYLWYNRKCESMKSYLIIFNEKKIYRIVIEVCCIYIYVVLLFIFYL